MKARILLLLGAPITASFALGAAPVRAEVAVTKDQCVDANGEGQELRREGKLSAARERLVLCANEACPAIVRDDCNRRLDELEKAQPTITFVAEDASGALVTAVKVTVDGTPLTNVLDGTALPVDVGPHAFTFEIAGQPPVTRTLVITEGAKKRREVVQIGAAAPSVSVLPDAARVSSGAAESQKVIGLIAGGVGLVGVALGGVFGLLTISEKNAQERACSSAASCTNDAHAGALNDHSIATTDGTISTGAFIAGGALLAGGAVLFFTATPATEKPAAASMRVSPTLSPGGGGIWVDGVF